MSLSTHFSNGLVSMMKSLFPPLTELTAKPDLISQPIIRLFVLTQFSKFHFHTPTLPIHAHNTVRIYRFRMIPVLAPCLGNPTQTRDILGGSLNSSTLNTIVRLISPIES